MTLTIFVDIYLYYRHKRFSKYHYEVAMAANPFLQVCVCVFGGGGAENFTGGGYFLLGGGTGSGTIFTI